MLMAACRWLSSLLQKPFPAGSQATGACEGSAPRIAALVSHLLLTEHLSAGPPQASPCHAFSPD